MRKSITLTASIAGALLFGMAAAQATPKLYWDQGQRKFVAYENGRMLGGKNAGIPREDINYNGPYGANTIIINTSERRLYYVYAKGKALKYGVGVGREGFEWSGTNVITRKAEWPGWTPPPEMIEREKANGRILPAHMEGGIKNPLGARALYIGDTLYRIHGSNEPWTIGHAVSSGCIRMTNDDVTDLYDKVKIGTKVVVLR
jgi:lipoprotein-anchoring transpeptidase ErfK/SrfK